MIILEADVAASTHAARGTIHLRLLHKPDGWTYAVDGVSGGEFTLPWRADNAEEATRRLRESYADPVWQLTVTAAAEEPPTG